MQLCSAVDSRSGCYAEQSRDWRRIAKMRRERKQAIAGYEVCEVRRQAYLSKGHSHDSGDAAGKTRGDGAHTKIATHRRPSLSFLSLPEKDQPGITPSLV
jgi:hypothetical protein